MCMILRDIYEEIYQDKFEYSNFDHRIQLQKAVYLLENMGLNIGDYSFSWAKYGPYSLRLDGDALACSKIEKSEKPNFSDYAKKSFELIKTYLSEKKEYDTRKWVECIASIHFLKNICHVEDQNLLNVLIRKKEYLNIRTENERAYQIAMDIRRNFNSE